MSVDNKSARAVRRIVRVSHFADAEAGFGRIGNCAVHQYPHFQFVKFWIAFEARPPQPRVVDDQLRELVGGESNLLVLAPEKLGLFGKSDSGAGNFTFDTAFDRFGGRIDQLDRNLFAGGVVSWLAEFRFHERVTHVDVARGINRDAFPDSGVAVADTVEERKVPSHAHQHRRVEADVAVPAVKELACGSPGFLPCRTGHVYRVNFYGQCIGLAQLREIRNVDPLILEHAVHRSEQVAVEPHLGAVVDSVELHPDPFVRVTFRERKFGTEPIGVKIPARFAQVRDQVAVELIVYTVVRLGVNFIEYE